MFRIIPIFCAMAATLIVAAQTRASVVNNSNTVRIGINESMPDTFAFSPTGDMVFVEDGAQPDDVSLVHRSSGGVLITLEGQNFGSSIVGAPAVSSNGVVSFQCVGPGVDGVYARSTSGGERITIHGASFGSAQGAPSVSSDGAIAFHGSEGIYVRESLAGATHLTIQGQNFSRMGRPAINTALNSDVCVAVSVDDGSGLPPVDAVYVQHGGGGFQGTLPNLPLNGRFSSGQPKIIDNKKSVLACFQSDSPTGLVESLMMCDFDETQSAYSEFRAIATFSDGSTCDRFSICPDGEFMCATLDGGSKLIWSPRSNFNTFGPESGGYVDPITILSYGDVLGTSTVESITIADGSAQLDGSVMFHATLADGSSGLYLSMLPEPTTLVTAAAFAALAVSRKRRSL